MLANKKKPERRTEILQVGVSKKEKLYISLFTNKHNYKTISKACRTLILNSIREIEYTDEFKETPVKTEIDIKPIVDEIKNLLRPSVVPDYVSAYIRT